jgi:Ser/Thr protein kinase RdoA (MazF antagonist)
MSSQLTSPSLATGRTAEIYPWQTDQVLKLFFEWFPRENIEYEARIVRAIQLSGLPIPAVGEILEIDGRIGLVYQRVNGESMWAAISMQPWKLFQYARRTADLHVAMHATSIVADIPPLHQKLTYKLNHAQALPDSLRYKALAALERLPEGDRLCHGDFHPANILLTDGGEVIIDWIDASLGNPLADLARTTILLLGVVETSPSFNAQQKTVIRLFHSAYLRAYFKLRPGGKDEYQRWLPVVAAARLSENIPELEKWLIAQCKGI